MFLSITADDYGLSAGINAGIESLAARSAITSVSIMVHRDANLSTVQNLSRTGVSVGLHLVLVEERPISDSRTMEPLLDGSGRLPKNYRALFSKLLLRPSLRSLVRLEVAAQIERYKHLDLPLQFINSHQHTHLFPLIWPVLADIISARTDVSIRTARDQSVTADVSGALALSSRTSWLARPLPLHQRLSPLGLAQAGHCSLADVRRLLETRARSEKSDVAELVVHPGFADREASEKYTHWNYHWNDEAQMLIDPNFADVLERNHISLVFPGRRD